MKYCHKCPLHQTNQWAYLNIQDDDEDTQAGLDFTQDVDEWHDAEEEVAEVHAVVVPYSRHGETKVKIAKQQELENWRLLGVFEEVPYTGQSLMSTRWVITEKETDGSSKLKARLVVRGYEEKTDLKSDSPTVHKESLQIFLAITSTCIYDIHSIDSFDVYVGFTREEYRQGYIYKTTGSRTNVYMVWLMPLETGFLV